MAIIKFQHYLLEHGFSRVMRILWGDVPSIERVGIITANNPNYQQLSVEDNEKRNEELWYQLRAANLGPIKIKGKFTSVTKPADVPEEDSFLVPHISRDYLVSLGKRFSQDAVIWGEKRNIDGQTYFSFEWVDCESGLTTQKRYVSMSASKKVQDRDNNYSRKDNRKFVLPFWDDPYANYLPAEKAGRVTTATKVFRPQSQDKTVADLLKRAESTEPDFEIEITEVQHGGLDTFYFNELPDRVKPLAEEIQKLSKQIYDNTLSGKGQWVSAGKMLMKIDELKTLVGR
jgi:hypothetical protein